MKVVVDVPPEWIATTVGPSTEIVSPDESIRVFESPLVARAGADARVFLEHELPSGTRSEWSTTEGHRARAGWAMALASGRVVDRTGVEREARRGAIYVMLSYVGVVVVCGPPAALERERATIDALLASARPHLWTEEPVHVGDFFALEEP